MFTLFMFTDESLAQLAKFEHCTSPIREALAELFTEVGDVKQLMNRAADALNESAAGQTHRHQMTGTHRVLSGMSCEIILEG